MTTLKRNYNTKDVDMIVTASTILETAIANKAFLQSKRSTWADPFFDNLKTRIDTVTQTYLGKDSAKALRLATQTIYSIQQNAFNALAEVKVQIIEDFKNDKPLQNEILNQLGFTPFHAAAQNNDQEALISLLYRFKTNLTLALKAQLVGKGIAADTIDTIIADADELKNADVHQETNKGQRKTITADAVQEFNDIFDSIMSICKIAYNFYKNQPHIQEQFSYNKVSNALNASVKAKDPASAPVA